MHAIGGIPGLYLCVREGGSSWIYRFSLDGRRRDIGLGSFGDLTMLEARERAREHRKLVLQGIDPVSAKHEERNARKAAIARRKTFMECVEGYIDAHGDGWRNAKHRAQWTGSMKIHSTLINDLDVAAIDTALVLKVLEPIWKTKNETASRLRGRIETALSWATVRGYRQGENPARWRGHLDQLLAKRSKVVRNGHHAALPFKEIGTFMKELRTREGIGPRALEFTILTAARTIETLGATWQEVDLKQRIWTVPASRMKAGKEHVVPLSDAALAVIKQMKKQTLDDSAEGLIFPGAREGRPMSNMAMPTALRRMNRGDITVHGFRSTFRDWCAELTAYPSELAEMALAHTIKNKVEAAYRRGDLLEKRALLMADWARYCDKPIQSEAKVLPLRGKRK
ncbi:MAG: tyrosine-type recombinase/integrase [Burkholderiales bacterium]|nr:tyrosine-type recombinase/integrase [Burkholderiales bacterium]